MSVVLFTDLVGSAEPLAGEERFRPMIGDLLGPGTHRQVSQNARRAKPVGMTPIAG
jgi:hypothetical protein